MIFTNRNIFYSNSFLNLENILLQIFRQVEKEIGINNFLLCMLAIYFILD